MTFVDDLENLLVWGVEQGWKLLGSPVNIYVTQDELGYTHPTGIGKAVSIFVNPRVLAEPRGDRLLRALILHELGHHSAHFRDPTFGPAQVRANQAGLQRLFNKVLDEHLERRLRSFNAAWGEMLDALAAWVFKSAPLLLDIERYGVFFGYPQLDEARSALRAGLAPGEVVQHEWGCAIRGEPGWVSYPGFVERVFESIERQTGRWGLAPDLVRLKAKLHSKALGIRTRDSDVLDLFAREPLFQIDEHRRHTSRRLSADMLIAKPAEAPATYLARIGRELSGATRLFPGLKRFVNELMGLEESPWFWPKQRSMLHNLRLNMDFRATFDGADVISSNALSKVFKTPVEEQSPGHCLANVVHQWQPEPRLNRQRPLQVQLTWLQGLEAPAVPSETRFFVALRLGLGRRILRCDQPALAAYNAIPKKLKSYDAERLWSVTLAVAEALGLATERHPNGWGSGPDESLSDSLSKALEQQFGELRKALDSKREAKSLPEIKRAVEAAKRRIDDVLNQRLRQPSGARTLSRTWKTRRPKGVSVLGQRGSRRGFSSFDMDFINLADELEFTPITSVLRVQPRHDIYRQLRMRVARHTRALRQFLVTLGERELDAPGHRSGRRIDVGRLAMLPVKQDPSVLVGRETLPAPDLHLGICIDASSSMAAEDRIDRAQAFATLLLESARGIGGVSAHACAFTDSDIYDLGWAGDPSIGGLAPAGGNNDAAGLLYAAQVAVRSLHRHRVLVMISDGYPTGCSLDSLRCLVQRLSARGFICAQVLVDALDPELLAFDEVIDLSQNAWNSAVSQFGRGLRRLITRVL